MNHKEFESLMEKYSLGTLPERKKRPFEAHMLICRGCRNKLLVLERILSTLGEKSVRGFLAEHGVDFDELLEEKLKQEEPLEKRKELLIKYLNFDFKKFIENYIFPKFAPQMASAFLFYSSSPLVFRKILQECFNDLEDEQKNILTMSFFDGKKSGEIAKELGKNPRAIYRKKSKALKALKKSFIKEIWTRKESIKDILQ